MVADAAAKPAPSADSGLKLRDLVAAVAETTGGKKTDVRKTVEAVLAEIGTALAAGRGLNLPQIGKLKITREAGSVKVMKLRPPPSHRPPVASEG